MQTKANRAGHISCWPLLRTLVHEIITGRAGVCITVGHDVCSGGLPAGMPVQATNTTGRRGGEGATSEQCFMLPDGGGGGTMPIHSGL